MKIWIIFVKMHRDGAIIGRYIDSHWGRITAATDRERELNDIFRGFSVYGSQHGLVASITEGRMADVQIAQEQLVNSTDNSDSPDGPEPPKAA